MLGTMTDRGESPASHAGMGHVLLSSSVNIVSGHLS